MTNIDYKKCKELRDCGFPQDKTEFVWKFSTKGLKRILRPTSKQLLRMELDGVEVIASPQLEEVIDELGDDFDLIERMDEKDIGVWFQAYMTEDTFDEVRKRHPDYCVRDCDGYESGDTALESAINLYIAINKK